MPTPPEISETTHQPATSHPAVELPLVCVGRAREQFDEAMKQELWEARRRALLRSIDSGSRLGDLLELLDDGGYILDEDDLLTVGDLVGWTGHGPSVVKVLGEFELPLDSPLDVATDSQRELPLVRLLLPACDR